MKLDFHVHSVRASQPTEPFCSIMVGAERLFLI